VTACEHNIDKFFAIARERYSILLKRKAGLPKPWSEDPIFQREYFCNVFREDDRTTTWFRENIRDPLRNDPREVLAAIVAFRWFNKIETGEKIKEFLLGEWDSVKVFNRLQNVKPVVTGAYIIKTPDGMTKLKGVLWCIDKFLETMEKERHYFLTLMGGAYSMQTACELLQHAPYLGDFMSWQICSDLRQTCILESALDKDTWAQPGPGSTRGIGRVYYGDVNRFNYGSVHDQCEMLALMNDLSNKSHEKKYWPEHWPKMAVIDISHQLCEYDKHCRAAEGGRMKRKYNAT
jgi:5-hmdU DNA kinase-like protein